MTVRALRDEVQLCADQLAGIAAWHEARRAAQAAATGSGPGHNREAQLDAARRADVLRCEHAAIIERTREQLRHSEHLLHTAAPTRAVLAHCDDWFKDGVARGLSAAGVTVVARPANGAEAVGVVVAEQPDLVLVADRLVMVKGSDVIREIRQFAPHTLVAAQADSGATVGELLEAGAQTVYTRRVSARDVSRELSLLVAG